MVYIVNLGVIQDPKYGTIRINPFPVSTPVDTSNVHINVIQPQTYGETVNSTYVQKPVNIRENIPSDEKQWSYTSIINIYTK